MQDAPLSQATLPTQAEETSDSSSSSDSDEEEMSKQPPKPGQFYQEDAVSAGPDQGGNSVLLSRGRCVTFV